MASVSAKELLQINTDLISAVKEERSKIITNTIENLALKFRHAKSILSSGKCITEEEREEYTSVVEGYEDRVKAVTGLKELECEEAHIELYSNADPSIMLEAFSCSIDLKMKMIQQLLNKLPDKHSINSKIICYKFNYIGNNNYKISIELDLDPYIVELTEYNNKVDLIPIGDEDIYVGSYLSAFHMDLKYTESDVIKSISCLAEEGTPKVLLKLDDSATVYTIDK